MTVLEKISGATCGCGGGASTGTLISVDAALDTIYRSARTVRGTKDVPLAKAAGRVLATSVRSKGLVPPFDNSAMDGYAINTGDLSGPGPWSLRIDGRIAAGQASARTLSEGAAVQVFTGAPVPLGANAVVMQENVLRTAGRVTIQGPIPPGNNIRRAGEDMRPGKTIIAAGQVLSPRDIAAAAAAGHDSLSVIPRLRVALVVTGDEVIAPGQARGRADIWDVNTPMIAAEIKAGDADLIHILMARDTRKGLRDQLQELAQNVDLIVTTGGISVGEEDHVKPALQDLGAVIDFSGVALKPGKPVSFGRLGQAYWLGLPGNPLSAFVTWQIFGKALQNLLSGKSQAAAPRRHVALHRTLQHNPGRCEFRLARLTGLDPSGLEVADFPDATHSGRVALLPAMDGLLFIPAETDTLPRGALAEFHPF